MTAALSIVFALTAAGLSAATGDPAPPGRDTLAPLGAARAVVVFQPPVEALVSDRFRPPATPYGPGNRGIDYATSPGMPVRAAAGGMVTFAGQVGGTLNVVVLHDDAIRTSYSRLASVTVVAGQRVAAGDVLGTSGADLHFGARAGRAYVDPQVLLQPPMSGRARLLPVMGQRP